MYCLGISFWRKAMIEKKQYGPVEFLPPTPVSRATLEIGGIKASEQPYTTYVFLDEVHGDKIEELIKTYNFAGSVSISGDSDQTAQLDITKALNTALNTMPNFHILFLTEYEQIEGGERSDPVFGFKRLDIVHTYPENTDFELSACVVHH
jgi:hypothetical protein